MKSVTDDARPRDEHGRFIPDTTRKAASATASASVAEALTSEIGVSGLNVRGGVPDEEWDVRLRGAKATKLWQEISDTDAIVGATLHAITMRMRRVDWSVEPFSDEPDDIAAADFVDSCRTDMSHTWEDFIAEATSMLTYGWAAHEIVYKPCNGTDAESPGSSSQYDDGLWRWRKLPLRAQETRRRWLFDESGGVQGLVQNGERGKAIPIGIEKLLLFRTTQHKGNPEGRSVLRIAARAYRFKKRTEELEGIGLERDLSGIPLIGVPAKLLSPNATDAEKAALTQYEEMGRRLRVDEQSSVIYPLAYDENGNQLYKVELMSSPGKKQIETGPIIERWARHMAMSVLADVILLGHERVGSQALSKTKDEMFTLTLDAWMQSIAEVLNRHAIPRLFAVNGFRTDRLPRFVPAPVTEVDLAELIDSVVALANVGAGFFPNPAVEEVLGHRLGIPAEALAYDDVPESDDMI